MELNYFLIIVIVNKLGNFVSAKGGGGEIGELLMLVPKLEQPQGISYLERERGDRER